MKNYPDVQLVKLLQEDSEQAFREIYLRHWKALYETAYHKVNAEEAGDMVQEIFLSLWKNRFSLNIGVQLNTYLNAALRYKIMDHYRLVYARRLYDADAFPELAAQGSSYELKELYAVIHNAVQRMPARMREIFLLNRDHGLPSAEIARKLSLSDQTVRNQVSTAIQRVRAAVERYLHSR